MNNPVIWCCGEEVFLVYDPVTQDWCGPFVTLHDAEECADECAKESVFIEEDCTHSLSMSDSYYF